MKVKYHGKGITVTAFEIGKDINAYDVLLLPSQCTFEATFLLAIIRISTQLL